MVETVLENDGATFVVISETRNLLFRSIFEMIESGLCTLQQARFHYELSLRILDKP